MPLPVERYRSVFISDLHLGSVGAKASAVREFLHSVECEHLFLVGDIVDGWVGRGTAKWSQECNNAVRTVLGQCKHGTQVYYTPGNHDAFMRRMIGSELGNLRVEHSFVHRLADGRDLLIEHGDLFDRSCTTYLPVAFAGAWMYEAALHLNLGVNRIRTRRNRREVDFTTALKKAVKRVAKRKGGFSEHLIQHAADSGCQGIVCGHIHRPQILTTESGMLYVNCGDWVEHRTAVVEHFSGKLELLQWDGERAVSMDVTTPMVHEVALVGATSR